MKRELQIYLGLQELMGLTGQRGEKRVRTLDLLRATLNPTKSQRANGHGSSREKSSLQIGAELSC